MAWTTVKSGRLSNMAHTSACLCAAAKLSNVKAHVLRYWEQEFPQLSPVKRRGNRRYYQRADVITIRQIRSLLYDQGYTIGGAKQKLSSQEVKEDTSQYKQLIRQMITELEEVLDVLNTPTR